AEAGRRRAANSFGKGRGFGQPSHGRGFLSAKQLHAQAHPVHAALQQGFDESGSKRAGSAFDRDLGIGRNRKVTAHGGKDAQQLRGFEDRRSSSAEINRVGGFIVRTSQ